MQLTSLSNVHVVSQSCSAALAKLISSLTIINILFYFCLGFSCPMLSLSFLMHIHTNCQTVTHTHTHNTHKQTLNRMHHSLASHTTCNPLLRQSSLLSCILVCFCCCLLCMSVFSFFVQIANLLILIF